MATITWTPTQAPGNGAAAVAVTRNGSLSTSDTYRWLNTGKEILLVEKTGATDCTITATTPATQRGVAIADPTFTCPATTGDVVVGPFSPDVFNDSDGYTSITLSNITGLTVAVVRLP